MNDAIYNAMDTGQTEEETDKVYKEICDTVGIELGGQVK